MPSYTAMDSSLLKSQVVKAYSSTGVYLGVIADAPYLTGFTEAVNAATTSITVNLPRHIDAYDGANMPGTQNTVVLGNVWKWYLYGPGLPTNGLMRYQGVVDTIRPHIDEGGGESVDVTITPYSQILGDQAVIGPLNYGTAGNPLTYVDSGTMFSGVLSATDPDTGSPYMYPFTLDGTNPATVGIAVQSSFQNQTLLSELTTILLLSPANYFFRMNDTALTITYNQFPVAPNHFLKLGQHITSMEYAVDNVPRKNMILVQGKGVSAKAVGASVATIGKRSYFKSDNRITDVITAQTLANGLLAFYDRSQIRTKIKIPDYRGDARPGIGYDIESFKVGQTVTILDTKAPPIATGTSSPPWGQFTWGSSKWGISPSTPSLWGTFTWGQSNWGFGVGAIFNVTVPIVAINYLYHSVELEIGFRQPSTNRSVFNLESKFSDATLVS